MNPSQHNPSPRAKRATFFAANCFVSHTLPDTDFCRHLVLPAIEAVSRRTFNQYVFMNLENFGIGSIEASDSAAVFAKAYSHEIERLLGESRYLLLVASRDAIKSAWVKKEVNWWLSNRASSEVFVVYKDKCDVELLAPLLANCTSFAPSKQRESAVSTLASVLAKFHRSCREPNDA